MSDSWLKILLGTIVSVLLAFGGALMRQQNSIVELRTEHNEIKRQLDRIERNITNER